MKKNEFFDIFQRIDDAMSSGLLNRNEYALAMILLSRWNKLRHPNLFTVKTISLMADLGMSKTTFWRTRNSLKQKGIIDFEIGKGRSHISKYQWFQMGTYKRNYSDNHSDNHNDNHNAPETLIDIEESKPLRREKKRRDKNIRAEDKVSKKQDQILVPPKEVPISKKYDPDEDVPSEVYKFITDNFGKQAIGIFKKNKVPLLFVHWIIRVEKKPLNGVRNPIFYLCALAKDRTLFGDFSAWESEQDKQTLKGVIPWMQQEV